MHSAPEKSGKLELGTFCTKRSASNVLDILFHANLPNVNRDFQTYNTSIPDSLRLKDYIVT